MSISNHDQRLLHRLLDGELPATEAAAAEARVAASSELRAWLQQQRALRAGFVAGREPARTASPGFAAGVMAAVRRLPSRPELIAAQQGVDFVRLCRRILIAAAVLFAVGLAWHSGLLDSRAHDQLQAAPDEIQQEMERLDALIQAMPSASSERR